MRLKPSIVYDSADLLVVNKPPFLLTVPDRYDPKIPNLQHWLSVRYGRVMPVHRLDKQTSGLVCFARTPSIFKHLSEAFEKRLVEKSYRAIVRGCPTPSEGLIDKPIRRMEHKNQVEIHSQGKPAQTRYTMVTAFVGYSLLDLAPVTGRTHQIRVHLQAIGHPLIVDPPYGGQAQFKLSEIKSGYRGDRAEEQPLLTRTPLHAYKLVLPLPGQPPLHLTAPLPKDMKAVIYQLSKQRNPSP